MNSACVKHAKQQQQKQFKISLDRFSCRVPGVSVLCITHTVCWELAAFPQEGGGTVSSWSEPGSLWHPIIKALPSSAVSSIYLSTYNVSCWQDCWGGSVSDACDASSRGKLYLMHFSQGLCEDLLCSSLAGPWCKVCSVFFAAEMLRAQAVQKRPEVLQTDPAPPKACRAWR